MVVQLPTVLETTTALAASQHYRSLPACGVLLVADALVVELVGGLAGRSHACIQVFWPFNCWESLLQWHLCL
jgi:hypothetical protein